MEPLIPWCPVRVHLRTGKMSNAWTADRFVREDKDLATYQREMDGLLVRHQEEKP